MKNNRRYDLSIRLIHFFRKLDLDDGSAPEIPEDWGFGSIAEHTVFSPLFLLRCVIRNGWMWATWSRRKGTRTIYGPHPAICFTDMPTAAFLETSAARLKKKEKISTYALTFPKHQMFALGARPVIYGLSRSTMSIPAGKDGVPRIMPDAFLPRHEQYRYVTYAPTGGRWQIDWTHEREWRWCMADAASLANFESEIEESGIVSEVKDIPGLDLYASNLKGIGVVVNTKEEAKMVFHDVLSLVDRKIIAPDTFEYVLVANDIPEPEKVRDPEEEANAIAAATIDLSKYLAERDDNILDQIQTLINQVNGEATILIPGERGTCWLWLTDNVHSVTRALVNTGQLRVNQDGKYLLPIPTYSQERGLRQREEMVSRLAELVQANHGVEAGYFSVLNSDDPNQLPNYNDDFLDNRIIYNFWSESL